jgi:hypothetical protein
VIRRLLTDRHVLAAIAQGVTAADDDVARAALGRGDWVLRGVARRRLNQLLIDAQIATSSSDDDAASRRHVLRIAALMILGDPVDYRDRDAVERAYDEKTAVPAPRIPVASIAAGAAILALSTTIAAATVIVVTAPPPNATYTRFAAPEPAGAFVKGGTPRHDVAIEKVLAELPSLVGKRAATRDPMAFSAYPAVASTWRDLIDAVPTYDLDDRSREHADLRERLAALSDQFVGAGLGYFVSLERTSRNEPIVGVYKIAKVTFVRANDERIRVLDAQRLGHADPARPVLGMKPEGMADPVVLLEEINAHVATQYLPVLDGAPYALADDGWGRTPRGRNATAAATRAIRRELGVALGSAGAERGQATIRLRKLVLASVRHHEAQHGREQARIPSMPAELAKYVGPPRDSSGRGNAMAVRARNELSAYISQIASDMWLPQASLWNLARHAFQSSRRGSPESFAAVIVLEGLARQLAISTDKGGVFRRGEIDRDRLAELVAPLAGKTTIELRSAAARLWAELFDEPLVRLVDDVFGE